MYGVVLYYVYYNRLIGCKGPRKKLKPNCSCALVVFGNTSWKRPSLVFFSKSEINLLNHWRTDTNRIFGHLKSWCTFDEQINSRIVRYARWKFIFINIFYYRSNNNIWSKYERWTMNSIMWYLSKCCLLNPSIFATNPRDTMVFFIWVIRLISVIRSPKDNICE